MMVEMEKINVELHASVSDLYSRIEITDRRAHPDNNTHSGNIVEITTTGPYKYQVVNLKTDLGFIIRLWAPRSCKESAKK